MHAEVPKTQSPGHGGDVQSEADWFAGAAAPLVPRHAGSFSSTVSDASELTSCTYCLCCKDTLFRNLFPAFSTIMAVMLITQKWSLLGTVACQLSLFLIRSILRFGQKLIYLDKVESEGGDDLELALPPQHEQTDGILKQCLAFAFWQTYKNLVWATLALFVSTLSIPLVIDDRRYWKLEAVTAMWFVGGVLFLRCRGHQAYEDTAAFRSVKHQNLSGVDNTDFQSAHSSVQPITHPLLEGESSRIALEQDTVVGTQVCHKGQVYEVTRTPSRDGPDGQHESGDVVLTPVK